MNIDLTVFCRFRWFRHKHKTIETGKFECMQELSGSCSLVKGVFGFSDKSFAEYYFPYNIQTGEIVFHDADFIRSVLHSCNISLSSIKPLSNFSTNPSVIVNDTLVIKFLPLDEGEDNPEVELLPEISGYQKGLVPDVKGLYRINNHCMAIIMQFIAGSKDCWETACTLLKMRDMDQWLEFCAALGKLTAGMHQSLRAVRGSREDYSPEQMIARIRKKCSEKHIECSLSIPQKSVSISQRIHGDYHLGQILISPSGMVCIDFEGEPLLSVPERKRENSPLKDVAGICRSFDYAVLSVFGSENAESAVQWYDEGRKIFIEEYFSQSNISACCDFSMFNSWLRIFEFDRLLYEIEYETTSRPDWVWLPKKSLEKYR